MRQRIFDKVVKQHFPNASNVKDVSIKYMGELQQRHRIDINKVLMATSLCSDDVNIESTSFYGAFFGPFVMGGLSGMPFVGKTGLTAFAHHVPDDGTAFILYGPHIGVTEKGDLGKICRPRMEKEGSSCGALMLALSRLQTSGYEPSLDESDHQQYFLETALMPFKEEIVNAENPVKEITLRAYDNINANLRARLSETKQEFHVDNVALLGGILINTDYGIDDYFDVKDFDVVNVKDL